MTELENLPTAKEDIVKLHPEFARLKEDSPAGCPIKMSQIRKYLIAETGRPAGDLFFGRTALVSNVKFWLWAFVDDGETLYVQVAAGSGRVRLGCGSGEGLTPEQYIALVYARHWRRATFHGHRAD